VGLVQVPPHPLLVVWMALGILVALLASGILPIPQFQAQHAELAQSAVTPLQQPSQTLVGNLGALTGIAKSVMDMTGESPEVAYQKSALQSSDTMKYMAAYYDPSNTPAIRAQLKSQILSSAAATNNPQATAAFKDVDPNVMTLDQQSKAQRFIQTGQAMGQAPPAAPVAPPTPQQTAQQGASQASAAGSNAFDSMAPPPVPDTVDLANADIPPSPRIVSPLEQDGSVDQAAQAGATIGLENSAPPIPEQIHPAILAASAASGIPPSGFQGVRSDGAVPATVDTVLSGAAPPSALFPAPVPPTDPQQRAAVAQQIQAGTAVANQNLPQATGFLTSASRANMWAAFERGQPLSLADVAGANLTQAQEHDMEVHQAQQIGAGPTPDYFKTAAGMTALFTAKDPAAYIKNNPGEIANLSKQWNAMPDGARQGVVTTATAWSNSTQAKASADAMTAYHRAIAAESAANAKNQAARIALGQTVADTRQQQEKWRENLASPYNQNKIANTNYVNKKIGLVGSQQDYLAARANHLRATDTAAQQRMNDAGLQSILKSVPGMSSTGMDPEAKAQAGAFAAAHYQLTADTAVLKSAMYAQTKVPAVSAPGDTAMADAKAVVSRAQDAYNSSKAAVQSAAHSTAAGGASQLYRTFMAAHIANTGQPDPSGTIHYQPPSVPFIRMLQSVTGVTPSTTKWKGDAAGFLSQAVQAYGGPQALKHDPRIAQEIKTLWEARQAVP
jgi:hypothetical protein